MYRKETTLFKDSNGNIYVEEETFKKKKVIDYTAYRILGKGERVEPFNRIYTYGNHYYDYAEHAIRGHESINRLEPVPDPKYHYNWNWSASKGGYVFIFTRIVGSGIYENNLFPDWDPTTNTPLRGEEGANYCKNDISTIRTTGNDIEYVRRWIAEYSLPSYILDKYNEIRSQAFDGVYNGQNPSQDPNRPYLQTWGSQVDIMILDKPNEEERFSFYLD